MGELECLHESNPSTIKAAATKYEHYRSSKFCLIIEVFAGLVPGVRAQCDVAGSLCSGQRPELPLYRAGQVLGLHWGPQVS